MQLQKRLEHIPLPSPTAAPDIGANSREGEGTNWKWLWTGCRSIHSKIDRNHWLVWIYPQASRWNYLLKDSLETKDHKRNRVAFLFFFFYHILMMPGKLHTLHSFSHRELMEPWPGTWRQTPFLWWEKREKKQKKKNKKPSMFWLDSSSKNKLQTISEQRSI